MRLRLRESYNRAVRTPGAVSGAAGSEKDFREPGGSAAGLAREALLQLHARRLRRPLACIDGALRASAATPARTMTKNAALLLPELALGGAHRGQRAPADEFKVAPPCALRRAQVLPAT
jgi:hypothetical protein